MNLNPLMAAAMVFFTGSIFAQNKIVKNSDFKEGLKHWMSEKRLVLPASETGFTTEMVEGTEQAGFRPACEEVPVACAQVSPEPDAGR